jgi:hypothetical protein
MAGHRLWNWSKKNFKYALIICPLVYWVIWAVSISIYPHLKLSRPPSFYSIDHIVEMPEPNTSVVFEKIRIVNNGSPSIAPSRPGEFHPEPLTDPCLTVSHHTAGAILESCRPPPKPAGSSCFQLALYDSSADDSPPSLHGHYSASSLLRGDPPLDAASVLSLSWFIPLAAFPLATTPSFPRSLRSPRPGSAHL